MATLINTRDAILRVAVPRYGTGADYQAQIDTINTALANIASDTKITEAERQSLRKEWDILIAEYVNNSVNGLAYLDDLYPSAASHYTAYVAAMQDLATYLNGGSVYTLPTLGSSPTNAPLWISNANLTNATPVTIVSLDFRNNWKAVYDARIVLVNSTLNSVDASITTIDTTLADIASDSKITAVERQSLRKEWDSIIAEYVNNSVNGLAYLDDLYPGAASYYTAYVAAVQDLANYLNAGSAYTLPALGSSPTNAPSWISNANLSSTSNITITGSTFRANWKAVYDTRTVLINSTLNALDISVTAIDSTLANIASDTKITEIERQALRKEWDILIVEYVNNSTNGLANLDNLYTAVASFYTIYVAKIQDLATYLNNAVTYTLPALGSAPTDAPNWISNANLTNTTPVTIVAATFRTKWKEVYDARTTLVNKAAEEAGKVAIWSSVISKPTDSALLNTYNPIGKNLIPNSAFEADWTAWPTVWDNNGFTATKGINYSDGTNFFLLPTTAAWTRVAYLFQNAAPTSPSWYSGIGSNSIHLKANTRYILSGYVIAARCMVSIFVRGYTAAGASVAAMDGAGFTSQAPMTLSNGETLDKYVRLVGSFTTTSDCAYVLVFFRKHDTSTGSNSFGFFTRLMLEEATAVSVVSEWTPGPDVPNGSIGTPQMVANAVTQPNQSAFASTTTLYSGAAVSNVTTYDDVYTAHFTTTAAGRVFGAIAGTIYTLLDTTTQYRISHTCKLQLVRASDDVVMDQSGQFGGETLSVLSTSIRTLSLVSASLVFDNVAAGTYYVRLWSSLLIYDSAGSPSSHMTECKFGGEISAVEFKV